MRQGQRGSRIVAAVVLSTALAGCTSVSRRSYAQPVTYVSFAAQEACLTAGCELVPNLSADSSARIEGRRGAILGFFAGQGGETIQVDFAERGGATEVTITSRKRAFAFLAQRHLDARVAVYLDQYIAEDREFEPRIVERTSGAQR